MTKFVKCIDNTSFEEYLTKGKIYEVIEVSNKARTYRFENDKNSTYWFNKSRFEEVKEETTSNFRFIPKTEITEVTIDGIEGILIKETS